MSKSNWWQWIIDLFNSFRDGKNEKPAPKPKPVDPVKPPTPPPNPDDEINLADVIWLTGTNPRNAAVTVGSSNLILAGDSIHLDWSAHSWGPNDGCDGSWNVIWQRDGKLYGCYIEWCPAGLTGYTAPDALPNIYHNPKNQPFPQMDDKTWAFILSRDGSERSNITGPQAWPISDDGKE